MCCISPPLKPDPCPLPSAGCIVVVTGEGSSRKLRHPIHPHPNTFRMRMAPGQRNPSQAGSLVENTPLLFWTGVLRSWFLLLEIGEAGIRREEALQHQLGAIKTDQQTTPPKGKFFASACLQPKRSLFLMDYSGPFLTYPPPSNLMILGSQRSVSYVWVWGRCLQLVDLRQGFDIQKNGLEDITGTSGLVIGVRNALRLQQKGLMFLGLPCNSHTWVSSSQHQRGPDLPFGNEGFAFVRTGNQIAYRSALLILVALIRGVVWLLENPSQSRCVFLPVLRALMEFPRLLGTRHCRWLGCQKCFCVLSSFVRVRACS